jgi:predicted transcriptional regulator
MTIDIPDDVALRLERLAAQHDVEVVVLLEQLMKRYTPEKKWATLADLARNAREAGMASPQPVNTAERSREILNTEYADYLKSRKDS